MTSDEYRKWIQTRSKSVQDLNNNSPRTSTVVKRPILNESLAKAKTKKGDTGRYAIRITSIRQRLLDNDNLCGKFHVDSLRYAGIISSDAPDKTSILTTQRKCKDKEEERIIIEIDFLD